MNKQDGGDGGWNVGIQSYLVFGLTEQFSDIGIVILQRTVF